MTENNRSEHPIKKSIMIWVWRIQQIATLTSLVLMVLTYMTVLSDKIQWRVGNLYTTYLLTLGLIGGSILSAAYLWDKKARMWNEQAVVGVERNPYAELKMVPKEVFTNQVVWIPLLESTGNLKASHILKKWTDEQLEADPVLKARVERIKEHFDD